MSEDEQARRLRLREQHRAAEASGHPFPAIKAWWDNMPEDEKRDVREATKLADALVESYRKQGQHKPFVRSFERTTERLLAGIHPEAVAVVRDSFGGIVSVLMSSESRLEWAQGVGVSAEPKADPALVADEQWGEEFER